ncbi:LIM and calponin homology domains-containing protein 1a isoform X13 [Brachyhypopomus gauderio]|uniref:LIM and calponin homology domains-containing protein 1a isoform X13 n=1 Tax=Brachyhypopomus gauderio TaxID=698409 RepID=UPI004041C6C5
MASPGEDTGAHSHSDRQEPTESTPEPAFQEAQKWIEAVTGRSFGDKDFRNGLENGILLCELLSSIKPGLVKKINRLPTPIAGLDNLSMFLRGCEELGLKGSQLFDPGDLQDTSVRANLTGSDCSRKLKNVLITIYWLGKTANSCASYNGPTLDLKEFEGLLSMMRKECVGEESDSPKRSIRDSGYIDTWESERSESLSPPRHGREDSFDSLDSFGSRSQQTPSPDTVLRGNSDDSEGDAGPRKLPDVRKDDMSARRVSYKEPRAARPFNQYLPNKSNQTNYIPAPLRKRRSDQDEERRSVSNATSPVGGERPLREECVGVLREGSVCPSSQKTGIRPATLGAESEMNEEELKKISKLEKAGIKVLPASVRYNSSQKTSTWAATIGVETEMNEEELKKMRKLEKAGIKVLPASLRYNSPKLIGGDPEEAKPPSPDIILRQENTFLRAEQVQEWVDEDDDGDKKVPDIRKDDLASRRARMNQSRPSVAHHFLPGTCSRKDQERWEGIRLASQHAVLEQMEKMQHDKRSEADPSTTEVSIITRKDNPFLNPRRTKRGEEEESEEEGGGQVLVPNPHKDDLARRRTKSGTHPQRDPRQSLAKTSITQSDLEKWQRLSMNTENSLSASAEVPSVTREDILTPEKTRERKDDGDDDDNEGPTKQGGGVVVPRIQKDDLAKRRAQSGPLPHRDFRQSLLQSAITQSDMETWQRLKMSTENSFTPSPVTTPPADVHNTPRKCAQMMESQETSTVGVMGGATDIVGGVQANSPPPVPAPNPRRAFFLEDDGLPPTFSHKAACVSDESESVSLIDMRDEEEADPLHNQFSKLREEEEQWQDDLARWKNRRRCASQDLIRKEEERKMMEKLMLSEGGAHRRKSIKTYKEIVEEKERREHELHESYCKASTPEEKAAVLQRYALRFTISDAILEKLQLPKLPSVTTTAPAQPQATYTLSEEVEVSVPPVSPQAQTQLPVQHHIPAAQISLDSQPKTPEPSPSRRPKTPEPSPSRRTKTPEAPLPITWVPPPPSKPVPLLTPKPYCQPKFSQISYKHVKTDGLVRVNGECHVEVNRESPAGTTPMPAASNSSVPLEAVPQSPQSEPEISPASEDAAQTLTKTITTQPVPPSPVPTTQETEQAKEETEDIASHQEKSGEEETSTTHADSQLAEGNKVVTSSVKCSSIVKTTIVTELMQTHPLPATDLHSVDQACSLDDSDVKSCDELSSSDSGKAEVTSYSLSLTESSHTSSSSRLRWEFFAPTEGLDFTSECIETPILNLAKRLDHWTWDPNEERKRQERWQQEQERLLQEKYQQEQERLKQEWEKAQKEVEEEERRHYEEERRILEETTTPLTPHSSALSSPGVTEAPPLSVPCHDDPAPLLAHPDKTLQLFDEQTSQRNGLAHSSDQTEAIAPILQNGQGAEHQESQSATPQLQFIHDESWSCKSESRPEWKKTASLDRNMSPSQTQPPRMRRTGSYENILGMHPSKSLQSPQDTPPTSSRSVSGKKLCSNCAQPLGKGAAMIIETLGLYFHIQCFKCGVCRGLLGETSAGTDVRIRNGVLSCQDCYIKSRAAGQPTTL